MQRIPMLPLRVETQAGTQQILSATFVVLVLFFWFVFTIGEAESRWISPSTLPSPKEVWDSVPSFLTERGIFGAILASMGRVAGGFLLAALVGIPLAIAAASMRWLEALLRPLVVGLRNVPLAALIPLTLIWFGINEQQKVMFIFFASLPFIYSDAVSAVLNVPERYVDTARTLGANDRQIVVKVLIPLAAPDIYRSLRALFGLAFGYIMLAESINTSTGLGALINVSQRLGKTEHIYLALIVIGILAFLIDWSFSRLERVLFPHRFS